MRLKYLKSVRIQEYLDKGIGECWLNNPQISQMVTESIAFFEGTRYVTHVFCIMPNHIHWLLKPNYEKLPENESALVSVMHSIKSFTAHRANKILNRTGHFWSKEYYDHRVRSSEELEKLVFYILENPVKAGLCKIWEEWPWTFCSEAIRKILKGEI
jgi:REP element-mobilizing transposase RayT